MVFDLSLNQQTYGSFNWPIDGATNELIDSDELRYQLVDSLINQSTELSTNVDLLANDLELVAQWTD